MKSHTILLTIVIIISCGEKPTKSELDLKVVLNKPLTEISGINADENNLWAITDKPNAVAYKLNFKGEAIQEVTVKNIQAIDVEAVTSDSANVYIGDVGDNDGGRDERQIIKFSKTQSGTEKEVEVDGQVITFRFADEQNTESKKKNNFDCESLLSMGDSLYLFTKRREDHRTELFVLPKTAGNYIARSLGVFDTHGLVTDAAVNTQNNELALCGYNKGHKFPFILLFKNFTGNNFFSGQMERIELADKPWDWQIEGITFSKDNKVYFSCEETKEVKSTLYSIERSKINNLSKK